MELYAAGFNAWNQLRFDAQPSQDPDPDDIRSFTCVLGADSISGVQPFLSYTLANTSSGPRSAGMVPNAHAAIRDAHAASGRSFAEAANGVVVVLDPRGRLTQYSSLNELLLGREGQELPAVVDVCQLVSYETGFVALSSQGQVWTWGDSRYGLCLGREVSKECLASTPSLVTELEDLPTGRIVKIAAGGYLVAALTSGHDLYCWGGHPGRPSIVDGLTESPTPVVIDDADIVDIGVGDSHLVALTDDGQLFVIGGNTNGQLGLEVESAREWTNVSLNLDEKQIITGVAAGPRSSFVFVRNEQA